MSSIYKKGRDGYYYYQAYIFNSESKKKDKKVYHSLGTKNKIKAEKKQKMLDQRYNKSEPLGSSSWSSYSFNLWQTSLIILGTITITIMIKNSSKETLYIQSNIPSSTRIPINDNYREEASKEKNYAIDNNFSEKNIKKEDDVDLIFTENIANKKISLSYTIERIDRPYGISELGKIYATIDINLSKNNQMLICKEILDQYSEFSNVIICLYTDNKSGVHLAKGNDEMVTLQNQKESWLGMYTYNSVEGEYFDDNPSGYLGNY